MGLYVRQDEQRSKLQEKIAADLRAKAVERSKTDIEGPQYDGERDASIIEGTHRSSGVLLAVWLIVGAAAIATVIYFIVRTS